MFDASSRGRRTFAAIMAGFCVVALAGCQSPESADTGEPLTREEFIEQGNAICAEGNAEIEAAVPEGGGDGPPSGESGEAFFDTIMESSTRTIDRVDALVPPADMQAEMDSIISEARTMMAEQMAAGAEALFTAEEDPWTDINARLTALGLTVCGASQGE